MQMSAALPRVVPRLRLSTLATLQRQLHALLVS